MSTFEVLVVGGVPTCFLTVATGSGAIVWVAGGSLPVIISVVGITVVLTTIAWLIFAPYTRNIWQLPRLLATLVFASLQTTLAFFFRGCKPQFPEWTLRFELTRTTMRTLRGGIFAENIVQSMNSRYFNWQFEWLGKRAGPKACAQHGTTMEIVEFNGLEHVWVRDPYKNAANSMVKERFVVLYYHGGGFVLFSPHFFVGYMNNVRTAILKIIHEQYPEMKNVSVECFLANYRKSPDYKYPRPQEDAVRAFEYLVRTEKIDPSRIVFMGDSAGGGLCASTMLRLKANGAHLPGGAVLSCPFQGFAPGDKPDDSHCVFALELGYAMAKAFHVNPHDNTTWKDAAAMYCDLSGLPPVMIQVGSVDTIYSYAVKLYEKAQADGLGTSWELDVFSHMPHAFTIISDKALPDVKRGIEHIAAFAAKRFARASKQ